VWSGWNGYVFFRGSRREGDRRLHVFGLQSGRIGENFFDGDRQRPDWPALYEA
jgi:hypothetical protein